MFEQIRLAAAVAVFSIACGSALPAFADGPVMVTVSGAVANTNRGPVDPDYDKLFAFNSTEFESAMEFDLGALNALPQVTVRTDFPRGGEIVEFSGPLLADVMAAAGAEGETVTISAMDGYAIDVPMSELVDKGAVLALSRDGKPFGIGNFGPAQVVFPRSDNPDLSEMPDDWWIWQIYYISVQ